MKDIIILTLVLISFKSISYESPRYPYHNFAYTGYQLGVYHGQDSIIPLAASLNVDPSFELNELLILDEAMKYLVDSVLDEKVIDCAYENSDREFPKTREYFKSQLYEIFTWRQNDGIFYPGQFYISQFNSDENVVGIAYLDLFYDRRNPLPGYKTKRYIHIALNSFYMGEHSEYFFSHNAAYWAGVIAHEILHNLNYDHPNGYPGSFIKEYGNCIWREGGISEETYFSERVISRD